MSVSRRAMMMATALAATGAGIYLGMIRMGLFSSNHDDLRRLLGPTGKDLVDDDARIAAWSPDSNYKPQSYYLIRTLDEPGFRQLAQRMSLRIGPTPTFSEAVWRLPDGVTLADWAAPQVPAGAGLQALGTVGSIAVSMRWHQGRAYIVATVAAP